MTNNEGSSMPEAAKEEVAMTAKTSSNKKMFVLGLVGLLVVVVGILIGVGVYEVYAKGAMNGVATTVARVFNLPAFKVNDTTVSYNAYVEDMQAIHHMQKYVQSTDASASNFSESDLSDQVIKRLVQNALVEQLAKKYGMSVADSELDAYKNSILDQRGVTSTVAADKVLMDMYGWDLKTYETKVMKPILLYQKVSQKVEADADLQKQIRDFSLARAKYIIANIKTDDDFVKFAALYSDDTATADQGGDLGWFGKGVMQPDFEKAAFALQKGEMVKEPVESPFGFHIIKVEDRKMNPVKDPKTGKTVNEEQIEARHILITPNLDKYLEIYLNQSNFHFYLPVHNPFTKAK